MPDDALRALAVAAGLAPRWTDNDNVERDVGPDILRATLLALGYATSSNDDLRESRARIAAEQHGPPHLATVDLGRETLLRNLRSREKYARIEFEQGGARDIAVIDDSDGLRIPALDRIGYHRLLVDGGEIILAVAPSSARTLAEAGDGRRMFGLAAQVYGLRTQGDDGAGHFGAVAECAAAAARRGADALALSPAHALFLADEHHFTPYSPSSRLFLNALYADPALVFGAERVAHVASSLRAARHDGSESLVDWPRVSQGRKLILHALYDSFRAHDLSHATALAKDFLAFRREGGDALQAHATFEALHAREFGRDFTKWHWRDWPLHLRDARSPAVADFARENAEDVEFHVFAQWLADRSMARAQGRAIAAGMRIGLVSDLAVGMNAGGSHAWSRPEDLLLGLSIGAPPDMLAPLGQNWGLTTFSLRALSAAGYAPFIATLRAALRNAGGVRIDHILGLVRLWLVPEGAAATDGVYLSYPLDDLLALIRLESHRHRAIVIGEDLGTVPHGLREKLGRSGVAGLRVLQFERDSHRFNPPEWYPPAAVAMPSTHDTATIAGWWRGADILAREAADQLPAGRSRETCETERAREKTMAWQAFADAGITGGAPQPAAGNASPVVDAAIAFVAKTPTLLVVLPLEDALGLVEQPNLPGTTTEHPNWKRRYPGKADAFFEAPEVAERLAVLAARRE
jgi:4-alpha-glucanotransferase